MVTRILDDPRCHVLNETDTPGCGPGTADELGLRGSRDIEKDRVGEPGASVFPPRAPTPVVRRVGLTYARAAPEVVRDRGALIAFFRDLLDEMPDWRGEPEEFVEITERIFLVRARLSASGKASRAPVSQTFSQVWELDTHGLVIRVREYADHHEALLAARAST